MYSLMVLPKRFEPSSGTPFGQFLEWLVHRQSPVIRRKTNDSRVHWDGAPVMEIVACGLWIVVLRAGKKLVMDIETMGQVENVSRRVDRLIGAGLLRKYAGDMLAAAVAFERDVFELINRAVALGLKPGMQASAAAWKDLRDGRDALMRRELSGQEAPSVGTLASLVQMPSAIFFSELMREAADLKVEIEKLRARFIAGNRTGITVELETRSGPERSNVTLIPTGTQGGELDLKSEAEMAISYLSLEEAGEARSTRLSDLPLGTSLFADPVPVPEQLRQAIAAMDLLRKLPFDKRDFADDDKSASISRQWLTTQLYLAAGDIPDGERLTSTNWMQAATALRDLSADSITERFFARMRARGMKDEQACSQLLPFLLGEIRTKKASTVPFKLDDYLDAELLIDIRPEDVDIDGNDANDIAFGKGPIEDLTEAQLKSKVFDQLAWPEMTAEDIEAMLEAGDLPIELIAEGIARMDHEDAEQAVKLVLAKDELTKETLEVFLAANLVDPTPKFIFTYVEMLDPKRLFEALDGWLVRLGQGEKFDCPPRTILACLLRLPSKQAKDVMSDPKRRLALIRHLITEVRTKEDRTAEMISDSDTHTLAIRAGADWRKFMLACEVVAREDNYLDADKPNSEVYVPPWSELGHPLFDTTTLEVLYLKYGKKSRDLLKKHPEDDIFRWLYEAEPDVEERLARYREMRDGYYLAFPLDKMLAKAESEEDD